MKNAKHPKIVNTHEGFVQSIASIVANKASQDDRAKINAVKLVYGAGSSGVRGVTYYNKWKTGKESAAPFVEISAFGQEGWIQLAGTTIHELAHVVAGWNAGHGKDWKDAAERLGLRKAKAAGHRYNLASLDPALRLAIAALPRPDDGEPVTNLNLLVPQFGGTPSTFKPCGAGIGTRGGTSRGPGSGSRLIKAHCPDCGYTVRVARSWLDIGSPHCNVLAHPPMLHD